MKIPIKNNNILYELYKKFLKEYQPYYNIFFLADLMHWIEDQTFINAEQIKNAP